MMLDALCSYRLSDGGGVMDLFVPTVSLMLVV